MLGSCSMKTRPDAGSRTRDHRSDDLAHPPTVRDAEKPLRRAVAMAYRTVREAGRSHNDTLDAAEAVYFEAHPEALTHRPAASARVNGLMIASVINVCPRRFWKNVRTRYADP